MAELKDSGNRREFETGAVRDMAEGKGRCDLLPLDVIEEYLDDEILMYISSFQKHDNINSLYCDIDAFKEHFNDNEYTMFLEVAKHFEDGAKKYGDNNWQKGIPVKFYIDSGVRHYLKFKRGDTDEPHDRAFVWNMLCAIWTTIHHPELDDYRHAEYTVRYVDYNSSSRIR